MKTIITNMCMVYKGNQVLVQNRTSKKWPGITFPGGHVEEGESSLDSVIREIKEETNLDISQVEEVGFMEWIGLEEDTREITLLYKTNQYSGTIRSSREGEIFWVSREEIAHLPLSFDFDRILIKYGILNQ